MIQIINENWEYFKKKKNRNIWLL
ncbi:hypothetical protein LCGC14_2178920, partial [marine sediment metagenome]